MAEDTDHVYNNLTNKVEKRGEGIKYADGGAFYSKVDTEGKPIN